MKYQMPEPPYELAHGRYTKEQVQAAFDAGRAAGLEAAAKECEKHGDLAAWEQERNQSIWLAGVIYNLAKETQCA